MKGLRLSASSLEYEIALYKLALELPLACISIVQLSLDWVYLGILLFISLSCLRHWRRKAIFCKMKNKTYWLESWSDIYVSEQGYLTLEWSMICLLLCRLLLNFPAILPVSLNVSSQLRRILGKQPILRVVYLATRRVPQSNSFNIGPEYPAFSMVPALGIQYGNLQWRIQFCNVEHPLKRDNIWVYITWSE